MKQINKETQDFLESFVAEYESRERALKNLINVQSEQLNQLSKKLELVEENYKLTRENYSQILERQEEASREALQQEERLMTLLQHLNATLSA